jgi:hypothetical protein
MMSFEEIVRKRCGRLTPQEVARTGYTRMSDYEKAYDGLYRDVEIQEKFGVRELAFSRASPFETLHSNLPVGEGALTDTIKTYVPKIAEVKHRQNMFDENGTLTDIAVPEEVREAREIQTELETREIGVQAQKQETPEEFTARVRSGLNNSEMKNLYADYLNVNFPTRADREQNMFISKTAFNRLSADDKFDYLVNSVFGGDVGVLASTANIPVYEIIGDLPPEPQPEEEEEPDID